MCFSCSTDAPQAPSSQGGDVKPATLAIVEHLSTYVQMTPLAIFAKLFLETEQLEMAARRMFGAYDEFLSILDDAEKRDHLDKLGLPDVAADPVYQGVRELGHEFQGALDSVFLDPEGCPELYELTKTYGVF